MRHSSLLFSFCVLSILFANAQTPVDTTKKKIPFVKTFYVRFTPIGIYTGAGYIQDRLTQSFEFGKTFGMIDIGLAYGRTALRKDTLGNGIDYLEGKITMDICQYGIFSNEMTVGAGGVFKSQNSLMLELSYTIYAQLWKNGGMGIVTSYYDFSGNKTDVSHNMFGVYFRWGIIRNENGGILNAGRMMRQHIFRHH